MAPSAEARLLDLVEALYGLVHLDEFREGVIVELQRAVPADWYSLNEFGPGGVPVFNIVAPDVADWAYRAFERYGHQNPVLRWMQSTQDGRPRRISDVATREEFHSLDLYREVYEPLGVEYQVAFTLPHVPPRMLGIAASRRERDFSDAERALLERARPFLIQGYRNAVDRDLAEAGGGAGAVHAALRARGLTAREAETIRLVALGRSNRDAALELGVSVRTVQKHAERAFRKLGVGTRSEAARTAWTLVGAGAAAGDGDGGKRRAAPASDSAASSTARRASSGSSTTASPASFRISRVSQFAPA